MRKDFTNIIPACLVDSVHDAIVPVIKCYDACNIFNMEIGLWLIVMIVPLLIMKFQAFENDRYTDVCIDSTSYSIQL